MSEDSDVTWITVNGSHVPIKEGQTAGAAITAHFNKTDNGKAPIKEYTKQKQNITLYHATNKGNAEKISRNGIRPSISKKASIDSRLNAKAVYGFDSIDAAKNFAYENNIGDNYVIFSFNSNNPTLDTEYDSGSYAVLTNSNIPASIVEKDKL